MNADDYQKAALRTEYTPTFAAGNLRLSRLLHAAIGICTEGGELQDMIKKHLIYGKDFDPVNVIEECGDLLWYIALALDATGYTLSECMERNINKLRVRYPSKFEPEQALTRDLAAERVALTASCDLGWLAPSQTHVCKRHENGYHVCECGDTVPLTVLAHHEDCASRSGWTCDCVKETP